MVLRKALPVQLHSFNQFLGFITLVLTHCTDLLKALLVLKLEPAFRLLELLEFALKFTELPILLLLLGNKLLALFLKFV